MANAPTAPDAARADDARRGALFAVAAYGLWGASALFFKLLDHIDPLEVVAHRAFWAIPVAGIVLFAMRRTRDIARALRSPRLIALLCVTSLLVTVNWGVFVWAVTVERTLEVSLGYYINPLINVLVGFLVLGERFTRAQAVAIALAALAVAILAVATGVLPWIPLLLGSTFAAYGFMRKTIDVGPVQGFFVETVILSLLALCVVVWLGTRGETRFAATAADTLLLMACGPMTALPLMLFAAAARRLRFATLGLLQYIAPTGLFLSAVVVFGEPVDAQRLVAFGLIWTALALYSFEAVRLDRAARLEARAMI